MIKPALFLLGALIGFPAHVMADLYVDAASGNVGVETTTPANTLDIGNGGGIHTTSDIPSSTSMAL